MASAVDAALRAAHGALVRRVDQNSDSNIGSSDQQSNPSLSSFVTVLVPVAIVAGVEFVAFLILRRMYPRHYAPRTFLGSLRQENRSPSLPKGLLNWIVAFFKIPDTFILNHHSMDAYLFIRFLKIATTICFVGCFITWPVLFPVNATGGGGQEQLNILSFSNIIGDKNRYLAHTFIAWIFFGFVLFMVTRESIYYVNLRQAYLMSRIYGSRMSSRTVLFRSVPKDYLDEAKLRRLFGPTVKNIWIATDCKKLEDQVKERDKIAMKLEGAEIKLITEANKARLKSFKQAGNRDEESAAIGHTDGDGDSESGSVAGRWIAPKQRPTHRLKPLIGKKVDTIDWSRSELQKRIPEVEALQESHRAGDAKYLNSVFVEFATVGAAQEAYQSLTHHRALCMAPRHIGITPGEVIWSNLRMFWWERIIRLIIAVAFVVVLIIFWSIPVAFVGALSNIYYLINKVHFLKFLLKLPTFLRGLVTGLLPSVLLAVLMALLPIVLRLAARFGGDPSLSAVELTVQNSYFGFQVVQVFLVATLSSAASAAVTQIIENPTSVTKLLANQLPKASNFYISYIVLQGLAVSTQSLLAISGLVLARVLGKILDKSPRKMYARWSSLAGLGWGTLFPIYENLLVIALVYSCIAPLVLGFATIGLYLFYLAYRYNILFVNDSDIDTKGAVYPRALQHIMVGVYLAELCLIGLFGIKAAAAPLVLTIIFLVFTVLYHISLQSALDPVIKYIPKSIDLEEEDLLAAEEGYHNGTSTSHDKNGTSPAVATTTNGSSSGNGKASSLPPAPHKKPNFFVKWLRPDKYTDYQTLRRLVPRDYVELQPSPEAERNAYYNPAINAAAPLLWIPRDEAGVSRQEVQHTSKVIPITDEGAFLNEKNKIIWDKDTGLPPIYEEKVDY
ncbi:DUF221-domain-containing protein [Xylona heveae TC161]|uniref:DUF221-domain-containing protein n=1 Tax=Xylona heveae (strain CBS 132557 / TC161) TaxID=1328760 RepID=A0A165HCI4_XYLHT|nr:DUF221-domain-containing protein [Xylona heveae TC161]KZF23298.1 DUF221-domain-containing protein [Xylona heveae TC161]